MKYLYIGLFVFSTFSVQAAPVPFDNGDFSDGSTSWNDFSSSGSVAISGGAALLQTGAGGVDPFSAIMVQGDDGSFGFVSPISLASDINWLVFDASIGSLGADSAESGVGFDDALAVNVYDASDFIFDLSFGPITVANHGGMGFFNFAFDVSSVQGRDVALSFELGDNNDGFDTQVTIDNVQFLNALPSAVPAPSVLVLLLAALPVLRRRIYQA